jgi:hypothetical protein
VPLFKQPRAVRAKRTELLLGGILGAMLLGLAVAARRRRPANALLGSSAARLRSSPDPCHR